MRESVIIHTGPHPSKLLYGIIIFEIYVLYRNKCMKYGRSQYVEQQYYVLCKKKNIALK